jgi:DNA-binding response OmpR family regulator
MLLLVEDNPGVQRNNRDILIRRGYNVRMAMDLVQARTSVVVHKPDAIILDIMLPDGSGLDFLDELRQDSNIPVLLLTALGTAGDISKGLRAGGDDYLPKPYDLDVFLARVESLLRRARRIPDVLAMGSLRLDITANRAFLNGADLMLTQKEFALLLLFAQNEGRNMTSEYLYERVWGNPFNNDDRTLKKHISVVRRKLKEGAGGYTIVAYRYEGYRFEPV